jgi:rubrerythrin
LRGQRVTLEEAQKEVPAARARAAVEKMLARTRPSACARGPRTTTSATGTPTFWSAPSKSLFQLHEQRQPQAAGKRASQAMISADIRDIATSANWQAEVDSTEQYLAMAAHEPDVGTARVYQNLAEIEKKHAEFWETRLRAAGHDPGTRKPSWRARVLIFCVRRWGAKSVLETVASSEYESRNDYVPQKETAATSMTSEEHAHARVLRAMLSKTGLGAASFVRTEKGHRRLGGNALRAAVLGSNDGLSSNLSLVMGVAGASLDTHTILLTGIAGLLAGRCSMAMGEWISVTSSRELAEREIQTERDELEANPRKNAKNFSSSTKPRA